MADHAGFEFVGKRYQGLVPYPSDMGIRECFGFAEFVIDSFGREKILLDEQKHPDPDMAMYGSMKDLTTIWRQFPNEDVTRRSSDGQLFWVTETRGLIPFFAGQLVSSGLLNSGITLHTLDDIRAAYTNQKTLSANQWQCRELVPLILF